MPHIGDARLTGGDRKAIRGFPVVKTCIPYRTGRIVMALDLAGIASSRASESASMEQTAEVCTIVRRMLRREDIIGISSFRTQFRSWALSALLVSSSHRYRRRFDCSRITSLGTSKRGRYLLPENFLMRRFSCG